MPDPNSVEAPLSYLPKVPSTMPFCEDAFSAGICSLSLLEERRRGLFLGCSVSAGLCWAYSSFLPPVPLLLSFRSPVWSVQFRRLLPSFFTGSSIFAVGWGMFRSAFAMRFFTTGRTTGSTVVPVISGCCASGKTSGTEANAGVLHDEFHQQQESRGNTG